jgi:hypothetical protein
MEILQNPDVVPSNHIMTGTLPHALFSVRAVWSQFKTVKNEACAIYPIGTEVAVFIWATVQRRSLFKVPACGVSRRASGGEFLPPPITCSQRHRLWGLASVDRRGVQLAGCNYFVRTAALVKVVRTSGLPGRDAVLCDQWLYGFGAKYLVLAESRWLAAPYWFADSLLLHNREPGTVCKVQEGNVE